MEIHFSNSQNCTQESPGRPRECQKRIPRAEIVGVSIIFSPNGALGGRFVEIHFSNSQKGTQEGPGRPREYQKRIPRDENILSAHHHHPPPGPPPATTTTCHQGWWWRQTGCFRHEESVFDTPEASRGPLEVPFWELEKWISTKRSPKAPFGLKIMETLTISARGIRF